MAKESIKARQRKRVKMVAKYAEKRARLKSEGKLDELDRMPLNGSKVRLRNRCMLTGRGRGYIRDFGLSRIQFRDLALNGHIPGVRKASW
jgi:small subunit ribosomal protein S14